MRVSSYFAGVLGYLKKNLSTNKELSMPSNCHDGPLSCWCVVGLMPLNSGTSLFMNSLGTVWPVSSLERCPYFKGGFVHISM